jgi:hypothetical protein
VGLVVARLFLGARECIYVGLTLCCRPVYSSLGSCSHFWCSEFALLNIGSLAPISFDAELNMSPTRRHT